MNFDSFSGSTSISLKTDVTSNPNLYSPFRSFCDILLLHSDPNSIPSSWIKQKIKQPDLLENDCQSMSMLWNFLTISLNVVVICCLPLLTLTWLKFTDILFQYYVTNSFPLLSLLSFPISSFSWFPGKTKFNFVYNHIFLQDFFATFRVSFPYHPLALLHPRANTNLITVCISYFRYNVLRRMLPLANLFMAHFVLKKTPSRKICVAVFIIVAGCVLAGNSPFLWWAQNERKKLCVEQLLCPWNCITCIYASRRRNS